jgi:hypothetical protein
LPPLLREIESLEERGPITDKEPKEECMAVKKQRRNAQTPETLPYAYWCAIHKENASVDVA